MLDKSLYVAVARNGLVKVGISWDSARRSRTLGDPRLIFVSSPLYRAYRVERELKAFLSPWRVRGEWFCAAPPAVVLAARYALAKYLESKQDEESYPSILRKRRETLGWHYDTLAFHSGISAAQIANIEEGRTKKPREATVRQLEKALAKGERRRAAKAAARC